MCTCQREYLTGYSQSWSLCLSPPDWSLIHTELRSRSEKVITCGFFAKAAQTTLKPRTNMTSMTLTRLSLHRVKSWNQIKQLKLSFSTRHTMTCMTHTLHLHQIKCLFSKLANVLSLFDVHKTCYAKHLQAKWRMSHTINPSSDQIRSD